MDTWRLNFIDIDLSFNTPVPDSSFKGYMVVRAPKGTTVPTYFPKGSSTKIHSMLGIPTADWADLQEAEDYNNQFGVWLSAPPGTGTGYASYYGGVYFTRRGLFPFYKVTDTDIGDINFLTTVAVGSEDNTYLHPASGVTNSSVQAVPADLADPLAKDALSIANISPAILNAVQGIDFHYWGNPAYSAQPKAAVYNLMVANGVVTVDNPDGTGPVQVGTVSGSTLALTGTTSPDSFLYIDFNNLVDATLYKTLDPNGITIWTPTGEATYLTLLTAALAHVFTWIVNIEADAHLYIAQKSPSEKATKVTFTGAGYDKYSYTLALNAYRNEFMLVGRPVSYPTASEAGNSTGLFVLINDNPSQGKSGIYQSNGSSLPPTNVTSKYLTKYVRIIGAGATRDALGNIQANQSGVTELTQVASYVDKLFYITADGVLVEATSTSNPAAKINPNFNTISFKVEEEVYPGSLTSGGTFTGSLDTAGVDGYGASIYWPNVLPDAAFSFVTVTPVRTFDADVDAKGFYSMNRVVDAFGNGPATVVNTLKGQRFITKLVNDQIALGSLGSVPVAEFAPHLLEGWAEAAKSTYDPSTLFMEPTGIEVLKDRLFALRSASQKMATFISPRLLSAAEAADVEAIVVNNRITGTVQYVNQFLRKDTYTSKKYWSNLIGSIGTNLSNIMAQKQGGWAPMYTNASGLGGQLAVTVIKAKYEFDAAAQKILDTKGLNPIVLDPTYGVMILSQKTTQDPDNISDWSYLGHSMAFDLFKREIRDNVMTPQIGKPNDGYYQGMRQRQAEAILARRTGGTNPIWAAGKIEIASVNTDEIKAQRDFAIRITVKVNVFSETVTLTFVNVAQTTSIS